MSTLSPPQSNTPPEDNRFFEELERRRTRALVEQDMDLLEKLHSADYQLITPAGKVFDRARYLTAIKEAPFYTRWQIADFGCRVVSGMAVVRYRAKINFPSGKVVTCWHTDHYEKTAGDWQAVWSQATACGAP